MGLSVLIPCFAMLKNELIKTIIMKKILIVSAFIGIYMGCFAQNLSKGKGKFKIAPQQSRVHTFPQRMWVDVSGQFGVISNISLGIGAGVNLHYLNKNRRHFQLRYNYVEDLQFSSSSSLYSLSDMGYMFGWLRARKYSLMEFAVGLSCVAGNTPGREIPGYWGSTYANDPFVTVGIPVEADIKFMVKRYFGLGLVVKANLNPKLSYGTLGIELTLNGPN
jgi:hypothetical protein